MANAGFFLAFTLVVVCFVAATLVQRSRADRQRRLEEHLRIAMQVNSVPQYASAGSAVAIQELAKPQDLDTFFNDLVGEHGGKWLSCSIAGVSHSNQDGSSRQEHVALLKPWNQLQLRREPDNLYDRAAVAILDEAGHQLGYVPAWLSRELAPEMDKGAVTICVVRSAGNEKGYWGAAIGVLWKRPQAQPEVQNEEAFVRSLNSSIGSDIEEWFWAKLTGLKKKDFLGLTRQEVILELEAGERLEVSDDLDGKELLVLHCRRGGEVGTIGKKQADLIRVQRDAGARYEGVVFEVRERDDGTWEPRVAIVRLKA